MSKLGHKNCDIENLSERHFHPKEISFSKQLNEQHGFLTWRRKKVT